MFFFTLDNAIKILKSRTLPLYSKFNFEQSFHSFIHSFLPNKSIFKTDAWNRTTKKCQRFLNFHRVDLNVYVLSVHVDCAHIFRFGSIRVIHRRGQVPLQMIDITFIILLEIYLFELSAYIIKKTLSSHLLVVIFVGAERSLSLLNPFNCQYITKMLEFNKSSIRFFLIFLILGQRRCFIGKIRCRQCYRS